MAEEVKKDEPKKKGPLGKLKEAVDDKEEQLLILSTFVRLGVMIWAGAILTLNYVEIPGYKQEQKIDPTFIASVFTGVLATFGVQAGGNKKKGPLGKLKEGLEDKEEQLLILSTFVRLGVMIWAGAILTLNYVEIPGYKQEQKIDPTFIASVFTGVLATFGVQAGGNKKKGGGDANISKKDMEFLIAKAAETAPAQTIRIESAPIKITPDSK